MSPKLPSLDILIETLLQEASQNFQETNGLKWEWDHYNKIYDLLVKIREKESGRDSSDVLDDEAEEQRRCKSFPPFLKWLEENGADIEKVAVANTGVTGFGLKTKVPLKMGELAFTVPKSIILTSQKARESKIKLLVEKDPLLSVMENVLLAIFLVYEKFVNFDNSFWKHYLAVLPSTFDTILYFTKEEITLLKQSPKAFRESLRMYRHVARQYAYFHTKFRKSTDSASRVLKNCFTYNRYIWGVSAVTTRINHLPSLNELNDEENADRILSLIPLWDLTNHEENAELSTDYNEKNNVLTCYASHDFDEDTEFKIYYGRRSSVDFLVHNGFVPESFRDDSYALELGVSINDPNYFRKKAILSHLGMQCQSTFNVKPERLMSVKNLFTFVRVFQADKETLDKIEANLEDLQFLNEPNEEIWKFLTTRFAILHKFTENSTNTALKSIYCNGTDLSHDHLTRGGKMLLQLLKNELKVLEMLVYCSNDHLKQCNAKSK